jgi:hypothetical protein
VATKERRLRCYGPKSENIHGFDERVSLASLRRITTAMALFVAESVVEGVDPGIEVAGGHEALQRRPRRRLVRPAEHGLAAFSRDDAFLSNSPPSVSFHGFFAEGYVLEEGSGTRVSR